MLKSSNSEISLYVDTMIIHSILSNDNFRKTADEGIVASIINTVKDYVGGKIDPNNKAESVLNILAPGAITVLFSALGLPKFGFLISLGAKLFGINITGVLESLFSSVKNLISGDKPTTSAAIDAAAQSAVEKHTAPQTETDAAKAIDELKQQDTNKSKDTLSQLLMDARLLKLAMAEFDNVDVKITKSAGWFSLFASQKSAKASMLAKILGWIFKIALASAGLMVAEDVVNKLLGRTSGTSTKTEPTISAGPKSTQKKFPLQPNYSEIKSAGNWIINVPNNSVSIGDMLISFAKKVYQGLDGLDDVIRNTAGFQVLQSTIANYNRASEGDNLVFMPKNLTSEKNIVDHFIDDVAANSK